MFEPRTIDTLYVARAFGIAAVVLNHTGGVPFHGGFNLLLMLSGISFATLAFGGEQRPIVETITSFLRPLVLGSLALCLFWFVARQQFAPAELLMVSNWLTVERVSMFPIWYPQALLQMLLVFALLLSVGGVRRALVERPVLASSVAFALAFGIAAASKMTFDTDHLADKLPHLHAWNFVLGWLVWAVCLRRRSTIADRLALSALLAVVIFVMFPVLHMEGWRPRILLFGLPMLGIIWMRQIVLPRLVAHVVLLISQATLAIFFFHYPFLWVGREIVLAVAGWLPTWAKLGMWPFALAGPIVLWAAYTALHRTFGADAGWRPSVFRAGKDKAQAGGAGRLMPSWVVHRTTSD